MFGVERGVNRNDVFHSADGAEEEVDFLDVVEVVDAEAEDEPAVEEFVVGVFVELLVELYALDKR